MQNLNTDWITTKELAEIKGISERAVRKSIAKNKYVVRKSSKSYEILVTSLELFKSCQFFFFIIFYIYFFSHFQIIHTKLVLTI